MRTCLLVVAAATAWATLAAAQTPDAGNERSKQNAGQSGAAASHTITPGVGEARQITSTAGPLSLSDDQRKKLTDYFAHAGKVNDAKDTKFTVSVGAAVPRQVALAPLAPELKQILPTYQNDQYVVIDDRLVIATPDDRRIVAIVPKVPK